MKLQRMFNVQIRNNLRTGRRLLCIPLCKVRRISINRRNRNSEDNAIVGPCLRKRSCSVWSPVQSRRSPDRDRSIICCWSSHPTSCLLWEKLWEKLRMLRQDNRRVYASRSRRSSIWLELQKSLWRVSELWNPWELRDREEHCFRCWCSLSCFDSVQ